MKIEFEHRYWDLDIEAVDIAQGERIHAYTGLSPMAWLKSLTDPESQVWLKSMQCLYWLMREQNDETPNNLKTANFAPFKLLAAFNDASKDELGDAAAEAEPDPTNSADGNVAE